MGRLVPSATNLQHQLLRAARPLCSKIGKPNPTTKVPPEIVQTATLPATAATSSFIKNKPLKIQRPTTNKMQRGSEETPDRVPLSEVVADCVKRWFQDTLREAKSGDSAMQILVGQMYYSGYGVARDVQKGRAWLTKASKSRSSAWKVGDKRPGYNASDSDTDEENVQAK
ncbi:hypothetical protein EJ110_NYTH12186 [Nymphaea thermarum]|nr:hypothetical protein EJ110_NYTH12186 [Nymphaea thermarum]